MYVMALPRTTIGKKIIMAVTGLVWLGFVLLHMYGNLKAFGGAAYFNEYAEGLRAVGAPIFGHLHLLTVARLVLVGSIVLHVWAAVTLTQQAQRARPRNYTLKKRVQANYASLTMRWGGAVLFLFIVYHLMHFTWGIRVAPGEFIHGDAYGNLVRGFQFWPVTVFYLVAVSALAFHTYHGGWSLFQTLGLNNENTEKPLRGLAFGLALLLGVGFAIVPVAVMIGVIR
jgi:succinate dehydrogenase / fumarate reductase cytochrome b subunit